MPIQRTIGVSIVSLLPVSKVSMVTDLFLAEGGWEQIARKLDLGNYQLGLQLLPLRGLKEDFIHLLRRRGIEILSFEGPWNCGGRFSQFHQGFLRHMGVKDRGYPTLVPDVVIFGSKPTCKQRVRMVRALAPNALAIDMPGWVANSAIELSPDMYEGNARQWEGFTPSGVVVDTYHWRRMDAQLRERELTRHGGRNAIKMVHLKFMSPGEIETFLHNDDDNNAEIAREVLADDPEGKIPVVIEAKNDALAAYQSNEISTLRALTERIHELY